MGSVAIVHAMQVEMRHVREMTSNSNLCSWTEKKRTRLASAELWCLFKSLLRTSAITDFLVQDVPWRCVVQKVYFGNLALGSMRVAKLSMSYRWTCGVCLMRIFAHEQARQY